MAENKNVEQLTETEFAAILQGLIDRLDEIRGAVQECEGFEIEEFTSDLLPCEVVDSTSFSDGGYLTSDAGFVVRLMGGAEFQVTVKRSR